MKRITNLIYSSKTTIVLLVILILAMASATFIEDKYDTFTAKYFIYNALWFDLLFLLLALNFIGHIEKYNMLRKEKIGGLIFHLSFVVMILGAGITRYFGFEGNMHIREGEISNVIYSDVPYLRISFMDKNKNYNFDIPVQFSPLTSPSIHANISSEENKISIDNTDFIKKVDEQGTDALKLDITINDKKHQVTVFSGLGKVATYQDFNLDDLIFKMGYGIKPIELPFSIYLRDFILDRYPGSESPSSFASEVTVIDDRIKLKQDYRIFMNNVLDYDTYRFFQSSYDEDEKGTILTVNHDFWGTWISYFGYFLLTIGFIITLFTKNSRFLFLRRNILEIRKIRKAENEKFKTLDSNDDKQSGSLLQGLVVCFLVFGIFSLNNFAFSQSSIHKPISAIHTEKFGQLITQSVDGRFEPIHSLAYDVMRKLSKKEKFHIEGKTQMDAMQVFLDMLADPEFWKQQKIIYIKEQSVKDIVGITSEKASFLDFFDMNSHYKLQKHAEIAFRKKQSEQNKFDKEIIKVNERVNIFGMVIQGIIFKIFPEQGSLNHKWISLQEEGALTPLIGVITAINEDLQLPILNYSSIMHAYLNEVLNGRETGDYSQADKIIGYISLIQKQVSNGEILPTESKVKAEIFYNKAQIFMTLKNVYALLSVMLLLLTFIENVKTNKSKFIHITVNILITILGAAFLYHTFGMILRWYLLGHAPWSNGYEALILVAWGGLLAGFCFMRYSKITLAATTLLAFFTLMTASHSSYDPQLTNLQPVLKSYWLIIHVAILTISYGFLGLSFILGLMNLFIYIFKTEKNKARLDLLIAELTSINEMNLTIGIVLATVGTFLGGVWANESWGRYWGWDAKETWALIITITYTLVLHLRFIPFLRSIYIFNVATVIGFGSVLMTFFGVNYYLSKGMHSYAAGDTPVFPLWAWIAILCIILLIVFAWVKENSLVSKEITPNP